jgi:hypothetical protein
MGYGRALGWLVTSYVITTNVTEQFAVFGGSGALVFGFADLAPPCVLARTKRHRKSGGWRPQPLGEPATLFLDRVSHRSYRRKPRARPLRVGSAVRA